MPAFLLSPLLWKVVGALVVAAALAWAWHLFVEHYREQGRVEIRAEWKADTDRRIAATTAMTLMWDSKRQEAEKANAERDKERALRLQDARQRVQQLPPAVAGMRFPGAARRLLNEPTGGDSAKAAAGTGKADEAAAGAAADTSVGAVTDWGVTVKGMYQACLDRVADWATFYTSLRAAQPETQP